jgi:RNA polymerase sigma-70 factor (ECF subfamily)
MQPDDTQFVRCARQGDRNAYAALYDRYANLVRAICFDTTGSLEQSQDLAQEVFLRAYRKLPSLQDDNRFASWLIGIARHVGREWVKRKRRDRKVRTGIPAEALAVEPDAEGRHDATIAKALAQLPEKQRLALHLFYLQGKSADQAQDVLGMSSSGFYKLLAQASEQLTKIIEAGD